MKKSNWRFPARLAIYCSLFTVVFMALSLSCLASRAKDTLTDTPKTLIVGVAGTPPFVVNITEKEGISLEIWQMLALNEGWQYKMVPFNDVPHALDALDSGKVDVVVGPVSITSERARIMKFSQPYYQSSLSILSPGDDPSIWQRIRPFFSLKFFIAIVVFLFILGIVGTLLWLVEHKRNSEQFPEEPARGIANGMWCAIVTMSTTGYGDKAPITLWGRVIASSWMVISIIFATTMVAGIASTLTLTGMTSTVISGADELNGRKVAVVNGSPAAQFVREYGAKTVSIDNLQEGYDLLLKKQADAVVYDRPQLLYFLNRHHDEHMAVSVAEYDQQGYGFALPINTPLLHQVNVALLQLEESGQVDRILKAWLGEKK